MKKFILTLIFMAIVKLIFSQSLSTSQSYLTPIAITGYTNTYNLNVVNTETVYIKTNISGSGYSTGDQFELFDWTSSLSIGQVYYNDTFKIIPSTSITKYKIRQVGKSSNINVFTLNINVSIPTGIADLKLNTSKLTVFPNPAIDEVNVSFTANKEKTPIEVFDIQGRLVMLEETEREIGHNKVSLNISNFSAGIYIVRAGSETFKITKI